MYDKVLEAQSKSADIAQKLQKNAEEIETYNRDKNFLAEGMQAFEQKWKNEHPGETTDTPEYRLAKLQNYSMVRNRLEEAKRGTFGRSGPAAIIQDKMLTDPTLFSDPVRAPELAQFLQSVQRQPGVGAVANRIDPQERQRRQDEYEKEYIAQGMSKEDARKAAFDRAAREIKDVNRTPRSDYQRDKLKEKEGKVESAINQIERTLQLIEEAGKRGETLTGVTGALGRAKEFAFGGSTDKAEFEQMIRTIQQEVPPMLKGTTRLSADERKVIDVIVPGLGFLKNQEQVYHGLQRLRDILKKKDLLEPEAETSRIEQDGNIFEMYPDGTTKYIGRAK
jgi:hypothetical protein